MMCRRLPVRVLGTDRCRRRSQAAVETTAFGATAHDRDGLAARTILAAGCAITTNGAPMIYSPVHLVRAVADIQCGADSIAGSIADCTVNGKIQTAAR